MENLVNMVKTFGSLITAVVALLGAWWAVKRFFLESKQREDVRREESKEREDVRRKEEQRDHKIQLRESQKPFLERQLQYYFDITKIVSRLATLPKGADFDKAKQRFWEFYWGELSIVESGQVEGAMVEIGHALNALDIVLACDNIGNPSALPTEKYSELSQALAKNQIG